MADRKIKVLVVDDSPLARDLLCAILTSDPDIVIAGTAQNGQEAVEKTAALKPDIATMDIEMPVMDGLTAIEQIMAATPVPILVVTTRGDAKTAYATISKGALDLVQKPDVNIEASQDFVSKIKLLSQIRVVRHLRVPKLAEAQPPEPPPRPSAVSDKVVAIASSTGGPEALFVLLSGLPEAFPCPVLIAQHISDGFATGMVDWIRTTTRLKVKVASDGDLLAPGTVLVSPSERHMRAIKGGRVAFAARKPTDIFRPSCDQLLCSVAEAHGRRAIGLILTGMGTDGVLGMKAIHEAGGATIAQDEKSSVVYGMPKVAAESGCVDRILPIGSIAAALLKAVCS